MSVPNKVPHESHAIAQSDFQYGGQTTHYRTAGSGPALVLVHGYPESSRTWERLMPLLAPHYTVIAPDTRGTGDSSITTDLNFADVAQDIHELVHSLGHKDVHLVGQDFGVQVVAAYTSLYLNEVKKLVVLESPLSGFGLEDFFASFWHFGFLASPFASMLIGGREKEFFSSFAFGDFVFRKEAFPPEHIADYVTAQTRPGRLDAGFGYYRALQKSSEFFLTNVRAPWTMPVLALDGDHGMQGATAKSFAKIVPGLQTGIVKDSGHFIQEEQPEVLAEVLLDFFSRAE
jgi:pimeloyl-ACP methyl ester carboxylesterase